MLWKVLLCFGFCGVEGFCLVEAFQVVWVRVQDR